MKSFDKANLQIMRADINAALAAVMEKHGVSISIGNISYSPEQFTTKLTCVLKSAASGDSSDNATTLKWKADFKSHAPLYGLKATDLGREVKIGSVTYTIAGARPRANDVIVLKNATGKYSGFNLMAVLAALK